MEYSFENDRIFTRLALLAGTLYPAYSLFLYIFAPDRYDDPLGRVIVGAGFLAIAFGSRQLGHRVALAVHVWATVCMVHFASMIARGGAENSLLFGGLILSTGLFFAFLNHPRAYLIHIVVVSISLFGLTKLYGVFHQSIRYTGQIAIIYGVKYFVSRIFNAHSRLIVRLRNERAALLEKQRDLIVQNVRDAQSVFTSLGTEQEKLPEQVEIKSYYRPATEAGGDWTSHFYSRERGWLVVAIGDVTGHDLVASLVTIAVAGAVRGTFESLADHSDSLRDVLVRMSENAHLAVKNCGIKGKMMSAAFVGIDLKGGHGHYISCAHPPLMQKNGTTDVVTSPATDLLGADHFSSHVMDLNLGGRQSLVLFTDGLVENTKKAVSLFRLHKIVDRAGDTFTELSRLADQMTDEDDLTFIVVELNEKVAAAS